MGLNTEPQINGALARALCKRHPLWDENTVHTEQRQVLQNISKQPDILIELPYCQPVIIETEVLPANSVEKDAKNRLGCQTQHSGKSIESTLAVVLPKRCRDGNNNLNEIIESATDLKYCTFNKTINDDNRRYPESESDWIVTDINGLADAIEHLSISERRLEEGTQVLEQVVHQGAELLADHVNDFSLEKIANELHQEKCEQTGRMATAIFVSAFVFHTAIEGQKNIPTVPLLTDINKNTLIKTWDDILEVNYYPIFSIARSLLQHIPTKAVEPVIGPISKNINQLIKLGVNTYHDLCGRMFQRLISDRKFLATFYTLPTSARLLAEIAVGRLNVNWANIEKIKELRIADFACGTGALLSAVQQVVYNRYRRAGGNDGDIHKDMIEHVLIGLDIMPAATHLTCSMLSSSHPSIGYDHSNIYTMPYGQGENINIGSLDLLDTEQIYSLFDTGTKQMTAYKDGGDKRVQIDSNSCNLVVMNPPFTRPTGQESSKIGIPVPSFAGFNTSKDEQRKMSKKLKQKYNNIQRVRNSSNNFAGHGNAGLSTNFIDLAHEKITRGGG